MSDKEKKNEALKNVTISYEGNKIVLPLVNGKPMSFDDGIEWLKRKRQEDEKEVALQYEIECSPLDGMVAFHRALAEKYGWVDSIPTPGFFGDTPPRMIGVPVGVNEMLNIPYGRIQIPGIEGFMQTGMKFDPQPCFILGSKTLQMHSEEIKSIAELTKKFVAEKSIYRGKAIKVAFNWIDNDGDNIREYDPMQDAPRFMDLSGVNDDDLIFGEKVMTALETGLFIPIEYPQACREHNVPLNRGALLYGPYGTGKTMSAWVTAAKAVRNGWTFIYLDNVMHLKRGLDLAKHYAPAILFAEDIDRAVNGERDVSMDEILNTIDGIDTKGAEIITVLTTNHVEDINPAMLRPGRIDTLIEVLPPDICATERLVRLYARGLLADDVNLNTVSEALAGNIPAFIREVVERAKIAAIGRVKSDKIKGLVIEKDILDAAKAMENHVKMLNPHKDSHEGNPEMLLRIPASHPLGDRALAMLKVV